MSIKFTNFLSAGNKHNVKVAELYRFINKMSLCMRFPKNVVCATSKASDQPAHMRSLMRAFASHLSIL